MATSGLQKKYHVYGIGNALVDMEFEVTPNFLDKMQIQKGLMTLVDEERQRFLINGLSDTQHKRACGGSAANTVIGLAQFGGKAFYSCKVASDELGDFYFQDLNRANVATNLMNGRENGVTGKCLVLITPDADRTMNTFLGITANFSEKELVESELIQSEYLYIEGYLVASPTGKEAAIKARRMAQKNGVKVALTFSDVSMVTYFREGLMQMMADDQTPLDILFCNEAEALAFTKKRTIEEAAQELKNFAKNFAVTLGAKGALIYNGEKEINILTAKVEAVDTNGAGDLFAGSFLYAITHGFSYSEAGRLACTAASVLVGQFGPRLKKEQILEIKKQMLGDC